MIVIFSIDLVFSLVRNVTPSFQSVSYHLHAPIWMALRKRGIFLKFASERGGTQKRRMGESNPGGNWCDAIFSVESFCSHIFKQSCT